MPAINLEVDIDLDFLRTCLVEAGQIAYDQRGQMIAMAKTDHSPVTVVDRQVEGFLIERIHARYPGHPILSEESGLHPSAESTTWIIDPIDGTRSFASGLPIWGVCIGVMKAGEPVAGGFYMPVTHEMYWGTSRQAFYNETPMQSVETVELENLLTFLAVPSSFHRHFEIRYPRVRSLGSTAAHLAYVATRAAVGALTYRASLWDIAGVLPLLAACGIEITTLTGQPFRPSELLDGKKAQEPLLAAHPSVIQALRDSIKLK